MIDEKLLVQDLKNVSLNYAQGERINLQGFVESIIERIMEGYYDKLSDTTIKKIENFNELYCGFKDELTAKYPNLMMGYDYIEEEDYFSIWHNQKEFKKFMSEVGTLLTKYFFNNDIYNFAFSTCNVR